MIDFKKAEDEVLDFWKENKTYSKVKEKNAGKKKFYFMDGPPYASGHIHMGTALNKILKDIAMRSKRLQGYDVFDRPGYDTHGVPIEFQVEKEIGSKHKSDIEKFGVQKFIDQCKEYATKFIDVMNEEFTNLGVWMDWDNPYLTLSNEYIEAIWSAFKKADEKGLLFLGKYPVHLCSRCETAVSYNEVEYGKQTDNSVFVKFPLKDKENTHLIIWTTTPWTLPANTGVMVHPDVVYQEISVGEERWIVAKDLANELLAKMGKDFSVSAEFSGKEMEGWQYENPLSKNLKLDIKNGYKVILSSRYVTTEEGTGLVHTAPGHGKEDYEVGKEHGLDAPCPVGTDGLLTEEAGKYAGKKARVVDKEIIEDLESDGFLVFQMKYKHDYPLCWRCKTPLLMVSLPQWFLKVSEIQSKLLERNEEITWVPDYMKSRMKAWLEGIGDWPVSRQRYWGTPLPIWVNGEERIVVGSMKELQELTGKTLEDLHKPGIDEVVITKNGKEFRRVPEVLDVWFDSGVSSWAALGYPASEELLEKYWPADLNLEGKDQFRGWWNSQIILSEIMFDKKPFENISVHGMVLDVEKSKMSKSKGNIVAPKDVIEKYSRDFMRYYFAKLSKGEDFSYHEREFKDIQNVFRVITNLHTFVENLKEQESDLQIEDKWILSRLHSTIQEVTKKYNEYKFPEVTRILEEFLIRDVSKNYIQIIRDRSDETYQVLAEIRKAYLKLFAPITPFVCEKLWQDIEKESIFLSELPTVDEEKINLDLEEDFVLVNKIIEVGLAKRDKEKIGLRWPLAKASVVCNVILSEELKAIIARQLNVKAVECEEGKEINVTLDLEMTPELEAEGYAREVARKVQATRKKRGLVKEDTIQLKIFTDDKTKAMLESNLEFLGNRTGSSEISFVSKESSNMETFSVKGITVGIDF